MKKIAIITARSGSKGLPNKNVLLVNGKPLIAYTIEAAIDSGVFDKIIVSTDSQEYIDLLSDYPIEFIKRAAHLASDKASSFVVIEDVLQQYHKLGCDYFMLLQPTSPLRLALHIQEACEKFEKNVENFDFLVSVSESSKSTSLLKVIDEDESLKNFQLDYSNYARQNYYPEYFPNGAIFVAKPNAYLEQKHFFGSKSLAYFMDKSVSIDIDDRQDFEYFYYLMQQKNKEKILLDLIDQEIRYKKAYFNKESDITFIGHSQLAQWDIDIINQKEVNNLAISGITTNQYIDLVLNKYINYLSDNIVIWLGINDLRKETPVLDEIILSVTRLIEKIRVINPNAKIFFLECLKTVFRVECNNTLVVEFNKALSQILEKLSVRFIALNSSFDDNYGKLNIHYTNDGLHLNDLGYALLEDILKKEIK